MRAAHGAAGGFVITSGRFTDEASKFADGRNVQLIDGPALRALMATVPTGMPPATQGPSVITVMPAPASLHDSPSCPLCSKPMMRRTAKRGANAGNHFWGCTNYPACRGTRPIA